jgi:hypothetical protein
MLLADFPLSRIRLEACYVPNAILDYSTDQMASSVTATSTNLENHLRAV